MTRFSRRALLGGFASLCLAPALAPRLAAQETLRERLARPPEYRIFDAPPATHTLSRRDVTLDDGRSYRLFIAAPKGEAPAQGWPSLWMLDGNSVFDRLGADELARHPGLAVIGVGYPVDRVFDTTARALDYTPKSLILDPEGARGRGRESDGRGTDDQRPGDQGPSGQGPGSQGPGGMRETGGADAFRARLTGPLREAVEADLPLDPARRMLWGHSYGGLFTLYCLLTQPEAFAGWIAVSPSSDFGGGVLRHTLVGAPHLAAGRIAPVAIMPGDSEHRRGTAPPAEPRPAPATMALAELLAQRRDLAVTVTVLEGLSHGETFAASFPRALDLAGGTASG